MSLTVDAIGTEGREAERAPASRVVALDAFRGLAVLGMLLVNNAALDTATPAQMMHAAWNGGVHLADLVFPWFLLAVGVAIPYARAAQKARGAAWWRVGAKVLWRSAMLVALGWLVDSSLAHRPVFGLGVLQLIGLAYLLASLLYGLPLTGRLAAAGALLAGHWALLRFLPVPGVGAGVVLEKANAVLYLNEVYLRPLHLQGLISVAPTAALVLLGTAVGDLLRRDAISGRRKLLALVAIGLLLAALGYLWGLDLPFSKALWTSSYILLAAGLGCLTLALWYALLDLAGWRAIGYPMAVFGSNAIFAYVVPILVKVYILQSWTWSATDGSPLPLQQAYLQSLRTELGMVAGGWLYTLSYVLFWWLVLAYLHRKRIFLRV